MSQPNRREMLGTLGALAAASGWIGLNAKETVAQQGGGTPQPAGGAAPTQTSSGDSGEYKLPKLPYDYADLEPHIDAQTMTLHHTKHHNAYVEGLNTALAGLKAVHGTSSDDDLKKVRALTDALAFNGSGHFLHSIFWTNMKKGGGGEPKGALATQITKDFGNFAAFQAHFSTAAKTAQGSGWGILAWEPLASRLVVLSAEKHQNQTMFGCVPLLVLDVWEHAYYLKYQQNRGGYVTAWWNVINWDNVGERLSTAMKLTA